MTAQFLDDYKILMTKVKSELLDNPELYDKLKDYIEGLENKKKTAQLQYIDANAKLVETDYKLTNMVKTNENLGDTLKLYQVENSALKEVVRAHGQLTAVIFSE